MVSWSSLQGGINRVQQGGLESCSRHSQRSLINLPPLRQRNLVQAERGSLQIHLPLYSTHKRMKIFTMYCVLCLQPRGLAPPTSSCATTASASRRAGTAMAPTTAGTTRTKSQTSAVSLLFPSGFVSTPRPIIRHIRWCTGPFF